MRSQAILKFLLVMAISVGKIAAKVRKRRTERAFKELQRLVPFVQRWKDRWLKSRRERVVQFIEDSLCQDVIYKLIVTWKSRVVSIQRLIKRWLQRRKAQKTLQLLMWNRVERALRTTKQTEVPPLAVKLMLISDLLKEKLKDYVALVRQWQANCERIAEIYAQKRLETLLEEQISVLRLPSKPHFPVLISREEVLVLMVQADKKKSRWSRLAKGYRRQLPRGSEEM